jgi:hypothetical protein
MSKPWRTIVLILATTNSVVCGAPAVSAGSDDTKNIAQISAVERITPYGQDKPVALKSQTEKNILTLDNDTVSCSLPEGDTTFIISLVGNSPLDRFTFINENTTARGELRIAVSNEKLSADSDKWTPVDGATSFKRKRLFSVSLLGVEAKYIRLTFHIEHESDIAAFGWQGIRTVSR